jgi:hypothetical protein
MLEAPDVRRAEFTVTRLASMVSDVAIPTGMGR